MVTPLVWLYRHEEGWTLRVFRFQCSWTPLRIYKEIEEWADAAHVAEVKAEKDSRFAAFVTNSGNTVFAFRLTKHRGIMWGWLRRSE